MLPDITVSLILHIGQLTRAQARRLGGTAGLVLLVLWAIAVLAVVTLIFAKLSRLEGYLLLYLVTALVVSFGVLPLLVRDHLRQELAAIESIRRLGNGWSVSLVLVLAQRPATSRYRRRRSASSRVW